jgi:hypothetical protein
VSLSERIVGDRKDKENVRELEILKQPIYIYEYNIIYNTVSW